MEDYGKFAIRTDGKFKRQNMVLGELKDNKINNLNRKDSKVRWKLSQKRRRSSQQSGKSGQDLNLELYSKHSSKGSNHLKSRSCSDNSFLQYPVPITIQQGARKQTIATEIATKTDRIEIWEHDERQESILYNKKISNLRYLISQTKQMISLIEAVVVQEDIKQLKMRVMEEEINVRRLKIGLRRKEQQKNVLAQYYSGCETTMGTIKAMKSERKSIKRKHSLLREFETEVKHQFERERKSLLRARANSIRDYIQTQKEKNVRKQQLLNQQITLLKRQSNHYSQVTKKTSEYLSKTTTRNENHSKSKLNMKMTMIDSTRISNRNTQRTRPTQSSTSRTNEYMNVH